MNARTPRIVVHSLAHARAALQAAGETGTAVTLIGPPGGAAYLGTPFLLEIVGQARAAFPQAKATAVVDCGDAPGLALAALRQGAEAVRLDAAPAVLAKVAEIAGRRGGRLDREDTPALDLLEHADPLAACRGWLAKGP